MWKLLPGHDGYEVSDEGEVRSLDRESHCIFMGKPVVKNIKGRTIKQTKNPQNGYMYVHLGRGRIYSVHRLVMLAFVGNGDGLLVRHLDGEGSNNALSNLAYGDGTDNYNDAVGHGSAHAGENHYNAILDEERVREIRRRCAAGESVVSVAASLGVKRGTALAVKNRKTWRNVN